MLRDYNQLMHYGRNKKYFMLNDSQQESKSTTSVPDADTFVRLPLQNHLASASIRPPVCMRKQLRLLGALWGQVSKLTTFVKNFLPELIHFCILKAKISFRLALEHESKAVCFLNKLTTTFM